MLSSKIGIHKVAGPAAIVLAGLSIFFVDGFGGQLSAAPFIAYGLPGSPPCRLAPAIVGRHDISYGAYIYAFPVQQQLLAVFGAYHWGVWWFTWRPRCVRSRWPRPAGS